MQPSNFFSRVSKSNVEINELCVKNGIEDSNSFLASRPKKHRLRIKHLSEKLRQIASSTTNEAFDFDKTIEELTFNGLVVASLFFHGAMTRRERKIYHTRIADDAHWMDSMRRQTDIGFILDRSAHDADNLLLEDSPWLVNSVGYKDPDFMRGIDYASRVAIESYFTATVQSKKHVSKSKDFQLE